MVTLKTIDRSVIALVIGVVLFGSYSWWRAMQQTRTHMMGTMPGMDPIWYVLGTLIAISIVISTYVISREQLAQALSTPTARAETSDKQSNANESEGRSTRQPESRSEQSSRNPPADTPQVRPSPLSYLPEDEQRVVKPVLESPGLTQVELRGRSDFSKAKVSQTVSKLEERGLIYREKQGRTYRVYPGELLANQR